MKDTLWPEVVMAIGLILTIVFFGYHIWNMVLAITCAVIVWRRYEVDHRGTLERQRHKR